jgi:hypothetical protein
MTNRPEDRQKVIGLSIGVVLVLIYFVGFVIPKWTSSNQEQQAPAAGAAAPPPAASTDATVTAPAALLAAAPGTNVNPVIPAQQPVDLYADIEEPPPPTSDPFSPPLPTAEMLDSNTVPKAAAALPAQGPIVNPAGGTPGISNTAGLAAVAPPAAPQKQIITVQGVVTGAEPIAVLKVDNQTRYERQGARLESGVVVARITDFGVQFQEGYRQFTLAIGHSTEPDQPAGKPAPAVPTGTAAGQPQAASTGVNPAAAMARLPGLAQAPPARTVPVALGEKPVTLEDPVPANQIASVAFQVEDGDVAPPAVVRSAHHRVVRRWHRGRRR